MSRLLALAVVVALVAATAGCAGEDRSTDPEPAAAAPSTPATFTDGSGAEIARAAFAAMADDVAVRVRGTLVVDGDRIRIDATRDPDTGCGGTMRTPKGSFEFVATDDAYYVKAGADFWRRTLGPNSAPAVARFADRWTATANTEQFTAVCGISGTAFETLGKQSLSGIVVGAISDFQGHRVVELQSSGGDPDFEILVSTDEPHYVRKYVYRTGEPMNLTFSDFGEPVAIEAPESFVDLR